MTLFWLVVAHCLADFPLQGDFLAKAKNRTNGVPGVPWWLALAAHSAIHAGAVMLVTHNVDLALAEFFCHLWIDFGKSEGVFGQGERAFVIDQGLHLACKVLWVVV